jgi:hypothetical protein
MAHIARLAQCESAKGAAPAHISGDVMAEATPKAAGGAVRAFDARARKQFLDHLAMTANVAAFALPPGNGARPLTSVPCESGATSGRRTATRHCTTQRRRYPRHTSPPDNFGNTFSPFGTWPNFKLNWCNNNPHRVRLLSNSLWHCSLAPQKSIG